MSAATPAEARAETRRYSWTLLALLALAGASYGLSFAHLGRWAMAAALAIAAVKAALVALVFMELAPGKVSSRAALATALWLVAAMVFFFAADVVMRPPPPLLPPLMPPGKGR